MSRVGKKLIPVPKGTEIAIQGQIVSIKGPKGSLTLELPPKLKLVVENSVGKLINEGTTTNDDAIYGLFRAKVNNMVIGVSEGYSKELSIFGVGYRASINGNMLQLLVGYSHPIDYKLPDGIVATVDKQVNIRLASVNKDLLGEVAAKIRGMKLPEPYKGKGIRYMNEHIRRKAGKVAGAVKGGK